MTDENDLYVFQPFHEGGRYRIETSPVIFGANQWTSFYMITTSDMKGLIIFMQVTINSLRTPDKAL